MDLISGFKSELFRPLVTLVVPGAVALAPHIVVVGHYFPQVPKFWDEHPSAFVGILVVAVIATGLILEDIGGCIETGWDKFLRRGKDDHYDKWIEYLQLRVESEFRWCERIQMPAICVGVKHRNIGVTLSCAARARCTSWALDRGNNVD